MSLRPTDNLMRVGCTLSLYLNSERGFRVTFGPWASYLPSLKTMLRILPMIFYTPALLAALISNVVIIENSLLRYFNKHPAPAFRPNLYPGWPYRPADLTPSMLKVSETEVKKDENITSVGNTTAQYSSTDKLNTKLSEKMGNFTTVHRKRPHSITQWLHILIHWSMRKTAGTLWSFGYYFRSYSGSSPLGSGITLDLQPFHPFGKAVIRRARSISSSNRESGGSSGSGGNNNNLGTTSTANANTPSTSASKLSNI